MKVLTAGLAALLVAYLSTPPPRQSPSPVRLAMVNVPDDIVRPMLPTFHSGSGLTAEIVYSGRDPFAVAREGKADLDFNQQVWWPAGRHNHARE